MTADIAVVDRGRVPLLVVEIKARKGGTVGWASQFRRGLLEHGFVPASPYFLLVTADDSYLWNGTEGEQEPTVVPTSKLLGPYVPAGHVQGDFALGTPSTLELLTTTWLSELTDGLTRQGPDVERTLRESGLLDTVRGGHVELQAVA